MKSLPVHIWFVVICFITGCEKPFGEPQATGQYAYDWENHIPFKTDYKTFGMPVTDQFIPVPEAIGKVELTEASGLAWSRTNPGMIWAHNDSGHPNKIFLIDSESGEIMAHYVILEAINIDWEDIEVADGPDPNLSYVYVADTGDNSEIRPDYSVYRFPEPVYDSTHYGRTIVISGSPIDRIRFVYPDGSHDTEAMFVDPITLDIFLVTKRDVVSMLYVIPYPQKTGEIYSIFKAGNFSFREVTAGTVSDSGHLVMIKNKQEIFYWERDTDETMSEMLARTPVKAPYAGEPQGEAICFDPEYNYFTLSESIDSQQFPILYKYIFQH